MSRFFALVLTLAFGSFVHADPTLDPAAKTALDKSARAYTELKGLSMEFEANDPTGSAASGIIAFQRPGKAKIELQLNGRKLSGLSDGRNIYVQTDEKSVEKTPVGRDEEPIDTLFQMLPWDMSNFVSTMTGKFDLIQDTNVAWKSISKLPDGSITFVPESQPDGNSSSFKVFFDPKSNLLRRIETTVTAKGKTNVYDARLSEIRVNPKFPSDNFIFKAPPGARILEGQDIADYDFELKSGLAPYELQGKDLDGKPHPWANYKGKVVLLDFWATWSQPCVNEIPNIVANYDKYHAKGFEVVGVSLDGDKQILLDFIAESKIQYPNIFDGKGWGSVDAQRYLLKAIPFSLLIGKNGKIAAIDARGEDLEEAIVKALRVGG